MYVCIRKDVNNLIKLMPTERALRGPFEFPAGGGQSCAFE